MTKKIFEMGLQQQQKHTPSKFSVTSPITKKRSGGLFTHAPIEKAFYGKALYQMGRAVLAAYTHLMLDVDIQRHALLPQGPKILAANHPTTTDPFYLLPLISEKVSFLVTGAAFNLPVVGFLLRAAGQVPVIRGGGATVEAAVRRVEAGHTVAIFPEGALSPLDGGFHRPHSGVARIALRTGAPVIPIGIGLQRECIRITQAKIAGEKATGHFYTRGPYAVTVGRPLFFEGDAKDHKRVNAVSEYIMHHIKIMTDESEGRIRSKNAAKAGTQFEITWPAVLVRKSQ